MKIHQVIEDSISSIAVYRSGLLELLQVYIILDKPEHYQTKVSFIKEIIQCTEYLTFLYNAKEKIMRDDSNESIRNIEEFLGAKGKVNF
jgi:5'(3')-deoxyribonucleotidase